MRKFIIMSIAALGMASTGAIAQTTAGGGASASGPNGSVAGGATAGSAKKADRQRDRQQSRQDRRERRDDAPATANSASTYGSGTIYTDRNRASGGVTAGGSASGTGSQSTGTTVDAYGQTTRDGSTAEVFGDSTAESTNPPVQPNN